MSSYTTSGYWYQQNGLVPQAADLLNLLRRYREAERKMRAVTRRSMGMNETDMSALRFLLAAQRQGVIPRQRDVAEELGISNASMSVLMDRLCRDGYAERVVHPADRRSVGIVPTEYSDIEVRGKLRNMHERMRDAASMLSESERIAVAKFLEAMICSVQTSDGRSETPGDTEPWASAMTGGTMRMSSSDNP